MNRKAYVFFDLAAKMNKKFSVIPLLYGSLGLQLQVEKDLSPDDIDICVPQHLYRFGERWDDLRAFMESEGYTLIDLHEHVFEKGDIHINFSAIDGFAPNSIPSIEAFVGIDPMDIPVKQTEGAVYRLLTIEQYYTVYSKSLEDNYRSDDSGHKDQGKVDLLSMLTQHIK